MLSSTASAHKLDILFLSKRPSIRLHVEKCLTKSEWEIAQREIDWQVENNFGLGTGFDLKFDYHLTKLLNAAILAATKSSDGGTELAVLDTFDSRPRDPSSCLFLIASSTFSLSKQIPTVFIS